MAAAFTAAIRKHYLQLRRRMSATVKVTLTNSRTFENVHIWHSRLFVRLFTQVLSQLGLTTIPLNHTGVEFHAPRTQRANHGGFDRRAPLRFTFAQTSVADAKLTGGLQAVKLAPGLAEVNRRDG